MNGAPKLHPAMRVHEEILRLAQTHEKRERIKWFHARQLFFDAAVSRADGLNLARACDQPDARYLVSLFPSGLPAKEKDLLAVFLAHQDDARCLCWAARCETVANVELLRRSAEGGYAWAQAIYGILWNRAGVFERESQSATWLEKSVAQGEREGMLALSVSFATGKGRPMERLRWKHLMLEGALLGHAEAQKKWATSRFTTRIESVVWLRRSADQSSCLSEPFTYLIGLLRLEFARFDKGRDGRIVFEIGRMLHGRARLLPVDTNTNLIIRALALHREWCEKAQQGILCWLWAAKEIGVVRDIRRLIAEFVWDERAAWSELRIAS